MSNHEESCRIMRNHDSFAKVMIFWGENNICNDLIEEHLPHGYNIFALVLLI